MDKTTILQCELTRIFWPNQHGNIIYSSSKNIFDSTPWSKSKKHGYRDNITINSPSQEDAASLLACWSHKPQTNPTHFIIIINTEREQQREEMYNTTQDPNLSLPPFLDFEILQQAAEVSLSLIPITITLHKNRKKPLPTKTNLFFVFTTDGNGC